MIVPSAMKGKDVAVVGLARSGLAAARALAAAGATVLAWDDAEKSRAEAAAQGFALTDLDARDWTDISALVLAPGIPLTHPKPHPLVAKARAAGAEIVGDIELLARSDLESRLLGITGTNGKSTTTALAGHLLKAAGFEVAVGGNLGYPVMDLPALGRDGVYVLELSSYQLDLIATLALDVAILLNVTPDHLERHGGMKGYVAAKRRIFDRQGPRQVAVVGV
ncbi:MAG: Mur ligase family protein, partial [Kiloniellales bacterium]